MTLDDIIKVSKQFIALSEAYPDYTVLTLTEGTSKGNMYCKYSIYTPVLCHNTFTDADSMVAFVKKVLEGGDDRYHLHLINSKRESLAYHIEQVEDLTQEINALEEQNKGG
jgi:hypothetical protein